VLRKAVAAARVLGLEPVLGPNAAKRSRFLAGADEERLHDLHWAFRDSSVKGILSVRGGYGTIRLLPRVDWTMIRRHPKVLVGMSDITAFQVAALSRGMVTFGGPLLAFGPQVGLTGWAAAGLWGAVGGGGQVHVSRAPGDPSPTTITPGRARGPVVGGNLTTLLSLVGTPWEYRLKGCIVVLEDVGEAPYRVDRMLTQFMLSGRLDGVAGLVFGRFHECFRESELEVIDVIAERVGPLAVPAVYGLPFGHQRDVATWPQGCRGVLDADAGTLSFLRSGVV
jgi:muramoyltetrapeptide carboxypeptidase